MILAKLAKYRKINAFVHANLKTVSLQLSLNFYLGSSRLMILISSKDKSFNKRTQKAAMKLKRRNEVQINVVRATSCSKRKVAENSSAHSILPYEFRSRMSIVENGVDASQNAINFDAEKTKANRPGLHRSN